MNDDTPRIALVRHAQSEHVHTGWIDAAGFRAWRDAYEAAGIGAEERPPDELTALAAAADLVVASDTVRAVATARLVAPGRDVVVSPLLREMELDGPPLGRLRLPLPMWALAVGGRILYHTIRKSYPPAHEAERIVEAATWLGELSAEHALIVVVTHGMFRRRLAARLEQGGWRPEPGKRTMKPMSVWLLTRGA